MIQDILNIEELREISAQAIIKSILKKTMIN